LYRDEQVAVLERVARLEERVQGGEPLPSRRKKVAVVVGLLLALVGTAIAVYVLGSVDGQTVMRSSAGHMVTVRFGTTVRDVHWFDTKGAELPPLALPDYTKLGNDPVQASSTLIVPDERVSRSGPTSFVVKYRAFGVPRRATVSFDATITDVETTKRLLAGIPPWVAFSGDNEPLLYFSTLLAYKYALAAITWGLDDGPLERSVQFAPSNALGIERTDEIYVRLPAHARSVRVKLRYKDGSESDVRVFERQHHTLR